MDEVQSENTAISCDVIMIMHINSSHFAIGKYECVYM